MKTWILVRNKLKPFSLHKKLYIQNDHDFLNDHKKTAKMHVTQVESERRSVTELLCLASIVSLFA